MFGLCRFETSYLIVFVAVCVLCSCLFCLAVSVHFVVLLVMLLCACLTVFLYVQCCVYGCVCLICFVDNGFCCCCFLSVLFVWFA